MDLFKFWSIRFTALCTIIFILQIIIPGLTDSITLVSSDVFLRPWTLVTSIFAHGSPTHLLYNMFALALFGSILESIVGERRWLLLFFSTGIIANIATLPFYSASLGASGAIFGLLGALTMLRPKMVVWAAGVPMPMFVAAAIWAAIDLFGLLFPTNIANAAHLSGLAFGLVAGFIMRKKFGEPFRIRRGRRTEIDESQIRRWENSWMG